MARGWESKAVEAQQDEARRERQPSESQRSSAEDPARRTLELARARTVSQLEAARAPDHRTMLERAVADIDARLADLDAAASERRSSARRDRGGSA